MNPDDAFVTTRGLRLHYREWSSEPRADRPTVVLVHGLSSTARIWDLLAPDLATDYRVLALDQRGHGETTHSNEGYEFPSIVADLAGFLDEVGVHAPALVVGHSWGASVALHFAVEHPSRTAGLVLLDGGAASPGETMSWPETLARLTPPDIDGRQWSDLRQYITPGGRLRGDPRLAAIGESLFHIQSDGTVRRRLSIPNHLKILRALWAARPAELLPRVSCPVLLLPARQASDPPEQRTSQQRTIDRALVVHPRARVRWLEDTIHDAPLQRPAELATEISRFAQEVLVDRLGAPR